ncbi:unnamed protein product [Rotaria sordida]|uniref:Uncharacterized protein n=2 Tax=Rotaria sordida TaxID=392033 RepID=A0A815B7Z3_9BILA|nr:unnamed protein product [Rotaria sordida]CAF1268617.1 unnamed protein product [Rotaria sordida]CAF1330119.1 unnamed protein product [Rotaria sordida]CAF1523293.1 unnamed protein product [Rotaria sordida]
MSSYIHVLIAVGLLSYRAPCVSGHAYFSYPIPRVVYCSDPTCIPGGIGPQGPVWRLLANSSLDTESLTTQTTCNGTNLLAPAAQNATTYDPGFNGKTAVSWLAGSSQTFQIFISQIHLTENQNIYPTDGWQIRYRDGEQADSKFSPIPFIYVNVSTTATTGPAPAVGFILGQTVQATITVPSKTTKQGTFQFFWRNNEVGPGVMWLSCVDVTITALGTSLVPSIFSIVFIILLTAIGTMLF